MARPRLTWSQKSPRQYQWLYLPSSLGLLCTWRVKHMLPHIWNNFLECIILFPTNFAFRALQFYGEATIEFLNILTVYGFDLLFLPLDLPSYRHIAFWPPKKVKKKQYVYSSGGQEIKIRIKILSQIFLREIKNIGGQKFQNEKIWNNKKRQIQTRRYSFIWNNSQDQFLDINMRGERIIYLS